MQKDTTAEIDSRLERYLTICRFVALFFIPVFFILIFAIRIERKLVFDGTVCASKQAVFRSILSEGVVSDIIAQPGQDVTNGQIILKFADIYGVSAAETIAAITVERLRHEISVYSNTWIDSIHKPIQREELAALTLRLTQESIRAEQARSEADKLTVRAPFDGTIVRMLIEDFATATSGSPLFEIAGKEGRFVRAWVPERQYVLVRKGLRVYLKSSIYNYMWYRIWPGKVEFLSPVAQLHPVSGETVFELRISILDDAYALPVNTSITAEVVRDKVSIARFIFSGY